jgi:hypothetical protein
LAEVRQPSLEHFGLPRATFIPGTLGADLISLEV